MEGFSAGFKELLLSGQSCSHRLPSPLPVDVSLPVQILPVPLPVGTACWRVWKGLCGSPELSRLGAPGEGELGHSLYPLLTLFSGSLPTLGTFCGLEERGREREREGEWLLQDWLLRGRAGT